jgi:hypothetical protein
VTTILVTLAPTLTASEGVSNGSRWDLYRYALNALHCDFIAVPDHNSGAWLHADEQQGHNTDNMILNFRVSPGGGDLRPPVANGFRQSSPARFALLLWIWRSCMSPDEQNDTAVLNDVVAACSRVMNYVHGASRPDLDKDDRLLSACCYQIAVIGECVPSSST